MQCQRVYIITIYGNSADNRDKKADVSMTLNGCLAGLVWVTAGYDVISSQGAIAIGVIYAIIMVIAVETIDGKLYMDDPIGAVSY